MATPNSREKSYKSTPPSVSTQTFVIAGILTTVYGLDELSPEVSDVTALWLLHPRGSTQACMGFTAKSAIGNWNLGLAQKKSQGSLRGLIAVSFDQRNHGTRMVERSGNESWISGNEHHAQDMFSIYS